MQFQGGMCSVHGVGGGVKCVLATVAKTSEKVLATLSFLWPQCNAVPVSKILVIIHTQ